MTVAELQQELTVDVLFERDRIRDDIESAESGAQIDKLMTRLNELNTALGDSEEEYDPLIAKWEAELEEGIIPNMDEEV